jgi:hypothetical protein
MKHEYRKHEKELYGPKTEPRLVDVGSLNYISIEGKGNPNSIEFSNKIEALFTVAYTLKMFPRKGIEIKDYQDYTVYPLEGVWDLSEIGRQANTLNKDELVYTIMIRQPSFMTEELFNKAVEFANEKSLEVKNLKWKCTKPCQCVQILHIGSFDSEPESFEKINDFCVKNSLNRKSLTHREIYLSDFRRVKVEDLKTILQVEIE